jgi:uncharacterized protein (TIGR02246 family)
MIANGTLEDRFAIRELLETYADAVTQRDAEAWGSTWAEDGEWSMPDYPEFGTTTGREAIVAMWVEAMKGYPGIMFVSWPGKIVIDGDTAKVRSYTAEVYDQGDTTVRDRGEYDDTLVKIDGRWFFRSRSFRNIHKQIAPKGC